MRVRHFQALWRLLLFGAALFVASFDYLICVRLTGRASSIRDRGRWLHRCSRRIRAVLRVQVEWQGQPPVSGCLVSNHLSYLDIVVLGAAQPLVFVAKSEVAQWPVLGWLAQAGGTLFIERARRADVKRVSESMAYSVKQGAVVAFFPEGTSSDGQSVLPFRSSL
ncbi:MAG: 1-acyl-sn-glycerol-3-phosphate acyltransferase, partial [Planctomycetota bacterium]